MALVAGCAMRASLLIRPGVVVAIFAAFALSAAVAANEPFQGSAVLTLAPAEQANEADAKKEVDKKAAEAAVKTSGDDQAKAEEGDVIGFDQSKVTAQMGELEQRMFRLSEGLKELEPENASRLMLGLKFAREELILLQMRQTEDLLKKLSLAEAATEEKQLLAKLERLKQLLVSDDLDFQLRLERLRLVRQVLKQLDQAIKEEDRELKQSKETDQAEKDVARLRKKRTDLKELIERQTRHVDTTEALARIEAPAESDRAKIGEVAQEQESTQNDAKALAASEDAQGKPSPGLKDADAKMGAAVESLQKDETKAALAPEREALDLLKRELEAADSELKQAEERTASERFASMRKDQTGNRKFSERVTEMVRSLGENGARALSEMIRAGGSMQGAEGALGQQQAGAASGDQSEALKSLKLAKDELTQQEQQLLNELHAEVRKRVIEALVAMLEKQTTVRETTTALAGQVEKGSRQAIASVVGLAGTESEIIELGDEALTLIEETGFGIALPSAMRVIRRQMNGVKGQLGEGQAGEDVVAAEMRIEKDLQDLLEAMKQMPDSPKPPGKPRKGSRDQERELNRLIAELKMVRLMQLRVNDETVGVDGQRAEELDQLAADLRERIGEVESDQDHVRETTERLAIERGQELLGP